FPRAFLLARGNLQVAAGKIDPDAVAPDVAQGVRGLEVAAAALERDDEFDLVVAVLGQRRVGDGLAGVDDRVRGLGEEERRVAHGAPPFLVWFFLRVRHALRTR